MCRGMVVYENVIFGDMARNAGEKTNRSLLGCCQRFLGRGHRALWFGNFISV